MPMRSTLFKTLLPLAIASLLAGACGPISDAGKELKALGQDVSEHSWRTLRILNGLQTDETIVESQAYNGQRFCYKTMSDIVCYKERLRGQDHRLTGKQPGRPAPSTGLAEEDYAEPIRVMPIMPAVTDGTATDAAEADSPRTLTETQGDSPLSLM